MQRGEAADRTQATLAVGMELAADLREWTLEPDGSHHVLQALARALVHVDVTGGDALKPCRGTHRLDRRYPAIVVGAAVQLDRDPRSAGEIPRHPLRLRGIDLLPRNPQGEQAIW
jgi:hypothetical protein